MLCKAEEINRASRCDKWGQRGHRSSADSAHKIPNHPALDLDALSQKFARRVTREESDRLNTARAPPGRGRAKGQGRGRGRGGIFPKPRVGDPGSNEEPAAEPPPELQWSEFADSFLVADDCELDQHGENHDECSEQSGNETPSE